MLFAEMNKMLKPHRDRLEELEAKAGIKQQTDRAREGSLFPLGMGGEDVDPEAYSADEADHTRHGTRVAYFSVQDIELRRELIKTARTIESIQSALLDREVPEKAAAVAKAKGALRHLPWGTGAVIALVCFGIGEYSKGTAGGIAGALFGLFMGVGFVWNSKGAAEAALEEAEAELKAAQRDRSIRKLHPPTFDLREELSGVEDKESTAESAYGAVIEFLADNPV